VMAHRDGWGFDAATENCVGPRTATNHLDYPRLPPHAHPALPSLAGTMIGLAEHFRGRWPAAAPAADDGLVVFRASDGITTDFRAEWVSLGDWPDFLPGASLDVREDAGFAILSFFNAEAHVGRIFQTLRYFYGRADPGERTPTTAQLWVRRRGVRNACPKLRTSALQSLRANFGGPFEILRGAGGRRARRADFSAASSIRLPGYVDAGGLQTCTFHTRNLGRDTRTRCVGPGFESVDGPRLRADSIDVSEFLRARR